MTQKLGKKRGLVKGQHDSTAGGQSNGKLASRELIVNSLERVRTALSYVVIPQ